VANASAVQNPPADLLNPNDALAPGPMASADDLLAQLAGEEIDRLLNEPDEQTAPSPAPAPAAQAEPVLQADPAPVEPAASIDDVLKAVEKSPVAEIPQASVEPLPDMSNPAVVLESQPEDSTAAEMQQLLDDKSITDASDDRLPIYVRALMMLNSPLAAMPNPIREAVGKVAILTLFNSVSVLLYVLLFRRH
jgi:hypothetical protein